MSILGKDTKRVEGRAKVTGKAQYAVDHFPEGGLVGFIVQSDIARGKVSAIDLKAAAAAPGVVRAYSHENWPKLPYKLKGGEEKYFRPLASNEILYSGQPVALVLAHTFEQARHGASLVRVSYDAQEPRTQLEKLRKDAPPPGEKHAKKERGNVASALAGAGTTVSEEYILPIEHHHPMETHGATATWANGKLTVWDKSQGVYMVRDYLAGVMGLDAKNISIRAPYVGGAFGSSLRPNYYVVLAAVAARELKQPVKLAYTRRQMATGHGYRPYTWQKMTLAADAQGKLTAIQHELVGNSPTNEEYWEDFVNQSRSLYACPNVSTDFRTVATDLPVPAPMRAPGAVTQMFALESALDELAYKLKIDPLELRLRNYAETDPETGKPFSSKALRECYAEAAKKFGWEGRNPEPRSMRQGRYLVGWGMATGTWGAMQQAASLRLRYRPDDTVVLQAATTDIGPGTYTVISMIAADSLGLPLEKIKFELGDTRFPHAPQQGGSWTTASVGTAVQEAVERLKEKAAALLKWEGEVTLQNGVLRTPGKKEVRLSKVLQDHKLKEVVVQGDAKPSPERQKYVLSSHGAQFVEVKVDPMLGVVRVTRVVEAAATGRILNPKAAHSQEMGAVVGALGMALMEETEIDHRYGRMLSSDLSYYHVPVNADILSIDTNFVDEEDKIVNPLGVKGMGELGMVGIPAAVANAVYHATGKRIRRLPITPDKLVEA
jgi:xanthine dehydrogenase YagR molybdenum-binding subunit